MITHISPREAELSRQVDALTAELARLRACLEKANNQAEHFEREWYLRGDELDRLRAVEPVEPVAWYSAKVDDCITHAKKIGRAKVQPWDAEHYDAPLYLAAPPAQPADPVQRLSDERIRELVIDYGVESLRLGSEEARHPGSNYRASFLREKRAEALKRVERAIESALQPGWRDIESAPKDGTEVALHEAGRVFRGCWMEIPFIEYRDESGCFVDQQDPCTYWMDIETGDSTEPTEWQARPLPLPPKATK